MDEIYLQMRDEYADATGLTLAEGGDMSIRMRASAAQFYSLWAQLEWLKKQCFPQTSSGEYLDYHAELRGITRRGATLASGNIRFAVKEALSSNLSIPEGTVCSTPDGREFETTEGGVITAGSLFRDVTASARSPGAEGNAAAGSITHMTFPPAGVTECFNPLPFSGGSDGEGDDELRARVVGSYQKLPNGANSAFYQARALEVEGVAAAVVLPKVRGLGTVDILVSSIEGLPSSALLEKVRDSIEASREICVLVEVKAPPTQTVNVSVSVAHAGLEFDAVRTAIEEALRSHFSGRILGKDLLLAELASIVYSIPGVTNYKFASPTGDVVNDGSTLFVLGSLSVTSMGA